MPLSADPMLLMDQGRRQELLDQGWEERFSAAGDRLDEMAAHYRALGYEVRIEALTDVASPSGCTSCFAVAGAQGSVGVLFTRAGAVPALDGDEFF